MTGWTLIDPILSVFVAFLLLIGSVPIIRRSAHILLQGTPSGIDLQAIADGLVQKLDSVQAVHHMHAWTLSGDDKMITLHVVPKDLSHAIEVIPDVRKMLSETYGIDHATIEVDVDPIGCDMDQGTDQIAMAVESDASAK